MKGVSLKAIKRSYSYPISSLILIVFFATTLSSCSSGGDDAIPPIRINEIPQDIKNLINFSGDEKAPTVLIIEQGGPAPVLDEFVAEGLAQAINDPDILVVNAHQAQTLNPNILLGDDISLEQSINFNSESAETLARVINYFKSEGRTVYVAGFSFGAFITQELIAKKGIAVADKYLIVTGRLDMNDIFWQGLAEGRGGFFENVNTGNL